MYKEVVEDGATINNLAGASTAFKAAKGLKGVYDALSWTEDAANKGKVAFG